VTKDDTITGIIGEYLRELSILVLVFFPLELSKQGHFSDPALRPLINKVAEFSAVTLVLGIIFTKWNSIKTFTKRVYSALRKEFRTEEIAKDE
jgi:hypothetical protein